MQENEHFIVVEENQNLVGKKIPKKQNPKPLFIYFLSGILLLIVLFSVFETFLPKQVKPSNVLGFNKSLTVVTDYKECRDALGTVDESTNPKTCQINGKKFNDQESSTSSKEILELVQTGQSNSSSSSVGKQYAQAIANDSTLGGLNTRIEPCGTVVGIPKIWGLTGEIIEGPIQKECLGAKYNWWKISWEDGGVGWSIEDNLKFSSTKFEIAKGIIEGGLTYPSSGIPNDLKICAVNLVTKTEFCTNKQITNTQYFNSKGYQIEVPIGNYNVYGSSKITTEIASVKAYYTDSMKCTMDKNSFGGCQSKENPAIKNNILEVKVEASKTTSNILIGDWWASF